MIIFFTEASFLETKKQNQKNEMTANGSLGFLPNGATLSLDTS